MPSVSIASGVLSAPAGAEPGLLSGPGITSSPSAVSSGIALVDLFFCAGTMVLLNWAPAFCATEKTDEKNPAVGPGDDKVPPGVLVSSSVGVSGELREDGSLPGKVADCALRCRMLSAELRLFAVGEVRVLAKVGMLECESVTGVGGVTRVVGVSWRFCGVNGRSVVIAGCFGVAGTPFFT